LPIAFHDRFAGPRSINIQQTVGDFIIATKAGLPAYQLAVVVDDARNGVTDVVRGDDLIDSTARQLLLYRLLGLGPPPRYWHLPLVIGPDGRRLAKRHGDTRVAHYREHGVEPRRIVGLMARWCGIADANEPMSAEAFAERFDKRRMPREPITFTMDDDAWLMQR
jgi:glutamyl-tRNA synthetase